MMPKAEYAFTKAGQASDANDFITGVAKVMTGENFSGNPEELTGDVDAVYDGHIEALEETRDLIGKTFNKVSERVTDEGPEVDDGLVEEVAEALVEGVEAVSEHLANCEDAGKVGEWIADVCGAAHDTLREGVGMGAEGIHAAGRALNGAGEEVASQFIETEQLIEAATNIFGEIALVSLAEEAAETAADMLPVVGAIIPTYNLIDGSLKTVVGAGGLVVGGTTAVLGGLVGAVAAPFDGGATWGGAMNVSRRTSAWSASVAGEGTLTAAKGAAGLFNQVPGTQVVTIPVKIGLGMGADSVKQLRTWSRRDVDIGVDDCEGVITENMVQVVKTYQLVSADGKRLLGASKAKSSRGLQMLGYRYGGYSLTFGDPQSAETEEEGASSFSFSGSPGTYRLHSGMHNNNTLFFMGVTYPAEWVVWDVEGKTTGAWEVLQLKWQEGGEKFKILGHGGQYAKWFEPEGIFKGTRTEWKATEFVLKEKNSG